MATHEPGRTLSDSEMLALLHRSFAAELEALRELSNRDVATRDATRYRIAELEARLVAYSSGEQ